MSFHLQKGFDITPNGVLRPGSLQDYRVLKQQPWFQSAPWSPPATCASGSTGRRCSPSPNFAVGDPNAPNYGNLARPRRADQARQRRRAEGPS